MMYKIAIKGNKPRDFQTIEKVEKTLGVTIGDRDRERIERASQKGDILYATFNPYHSEMGSGDPDAKIGILLADSQEELDRVFYTLREEI